MTYDISTPETVKITIIDGFTTKDGTGYIIMQWGDENNYILSSSILVGGKKLMTWEEIEEEKEKLINGEDTKTEDIIFDKETISEDVAYMPEDDHNKGYYYNTITGKIVKQDEREN